VDAERECSDEEQHEGRDDRHDDRAPIRAVM